MKPQPAPEKGLAYQGHAVGMAAMEHHSPEYLRINPLGVIPTLVHDGRPLHESGTISTRCSRSPAPAGYALRTRRDAGWLVGKAYSIADIAAAPFAKRIDEEIVPDQMTEKKHPHVAAWWTRLQARPAYTEANFGPFVDS